MNINYKIYRTYPDSVVGIIIGIEGQEVILSSSFWWPGCKNYYINGFDILPLRGITFEQAINGIDYTEVSGPITTYNMQLICEGESEQEVFNIVLERHIVDLL